MLPASATTPKNETAVTTEAIAMEFTFNSNAITRIGVTLAGKEVCSFLKRRTLFLLITATPVSLLLAEIKIADGADDSDDRGDEDLG